MSRNLTTQDISWFLDLKEKGQLNLDPPYQRRSVWSPNDKRFFVDTIFNNYPAPPIFLHKTMDENGRPTYHVVDGKQRLQTIIEFTQDRVYIPDNFIDVNLQRKRWRDLERATKERFWNYTLIVEMLNDVSDAPIKNIFDRINRNSRKLVPQEMRHAKYDGWFIKFAEAESEMTEWRTLGVVTTARIKRMADVQFISELLAIILKGQMQGFDHNSLDQLFAEYEDISDHPTFIEEDFAATVRNTKNRILDLLQREPNLITFFKIQSHFYTLWALLVLSQAPLPDNPIIAERYNDFLVLVSEVLANLDMPAERLADLANQSEFFPGQAVLTYANNVRGASTDLAQRQRRFEALTTAFNIGETAVHEDQ